MTALMQTAQPLHPGLRQGPFQPELDLRQGGGGHIGRDDRGDQGQDQLRQAGHEAGDQTRQEAGERLQKYTAAGKDPVKPALDGGGNLRRGLAGKAVQRPAQGFKAGAKLAQEGRKLARQTDDLRPRDLAEQEQPCPDQQEQPRHAQAAAQPARQMRPPTEGGDGGLHPPGDQIGQNEGQGQRQQDEHPDHRGRRQHGVSEQRPLLCGHGITS